MQANISKNSLMCCDFHKAFANIQTARSASCLLFLSSEILNISTSPHEFKMDSDISVAFPKLLACLVRKRLGGPVRHCYRNLIQSMCGAV